MLQLTYSLLDPRLELLSQLPVHVTTDFVSLTHTWIKAPDFMAFDYAEPSQREVGSFSEEKISEAVSSGEPPQAFASCRAR